MRKFPFRTWRRFVAALQAVVMLGLPFLRVHQESAFRFDVPSLKLYFFGSVVWISEAYFFLLIFLLFLIGITLATVIYGRIWCGWMCPQTVLTDFSRLLERAARWLAGHRIAGSFLSHGFHLGIAVLVAASLTWYFVSPYDMMRDIVNGSLGPWTTGSWIFFTVLVYLDLSFVRQSFCASVCPYARFQSAFFDDRTLTIAFDRTRADECGGCESCVRSCPSDIDIRDGLQVACINCAECIDACSDMTSKRNLKPLIGYVQGGGSGQGPRVRVIGLSLVFALLSVLFAFHLYTRVPMDFWVFRSDAQPDVTAEHASGVMNAYSLVVENHSLDPQAFLITITGIKDAELVISRNPVILPSNASVHIKGYVKADRKNLVYRVTPLRFILTSMANPEIRIEQEASFIYPLRTEKGLEI